MKMGCIRSAVVVCILLTIIALDPVSGCGPKAPQPTTTCRNDTQQPPAFCSCQALPCLEARSGEQHTFLEKLSLSNGTEFCSYKYAGRNEQESTHSTYTLSADLRSTLQAVPACEDTAVNVCRLGDNGTFVPYWNRSGRGGATTLPFVQNLTSTAVLQSLIIEWIKPNVSCRNVLYNIRYYTTSTLTSGIRNAGAIVLKTATSPYTIRYEYPNMNYTICVAGRSGDVRGHEACVFHSTNTSETVPGSHQDILTTKCVKSTTATLVWSTFTDGPGSPDMVIHWFACAHVNIHSDYGVAVVHPTQTPSNGKPMYEYTISGLQPSTAYCVEIQEAFNYGPNQMATTTFQTTAENQSRTLKNWIVGGLSIGILIILVMICCCRIKCRD